MSPKEFWGKPGGPTFGGESCQGPLLGGPPPAHGAAPRSPFPNQNHVVHRHRQPTCRQGRAAVPHLVVRQGMMRPFGVCVLLWPPAGAVGAYQDKSRCILAQGCGGAHAGHAAGGGLERAVGACL